MPGCGSGQSFSKISAKKIEWQWPKAGTGTRRSSQQPRSRNQTGGRRFLVDSCCQTVGANRETDELRKLPSHTLLDCKHSNVRWQTICRLHIRIGQKPLLKDGSVWT